MSFDPDKPYNDLPLLPLKEEIETKATLKKAISAGRALAELKGLGETIPNQAILVNSIILQEAKASSEIENIITTHDALFRAFSAKTSQIDPATKEVLRYREALWEGFSGLKDQPFLNHQPVYSNRPNYQGQQGRHTQYARNKGRERCDRRGDFYPAGRRGYHQEETQKPGGLYSH